MFFLHEYTSNEMKKWSPWFGTVPTSFGKNNMDPHITNGKGT
jgi:hypothetical protein